MELSPKLFWNIKLKRYVHITFSDVYGEKHDEIYYIDEGSSYKLDEKYKIKIVERYNEGDIPDYGFLDFRYLPPTEVIHILSVSSDSVQSGRE